LGAVPHRRPPISLKPGPRPITPRLRLSGTVTCSPARSKKLSASATRASCCIEFCAWMLAAWSRSGSLPGSARRLPRSRPASGSSRRASLTFKHGFAVEVSKSDRPFEVLHVGDHDPSGGHMFVTMKEDVEAFVSDLGGRVTFTRVAVTPAQVAQYALPTAPPQPAARGARRTFPGKSIHRPYRSS